MILYFAYDQYYSFYFMFYGVGVIPKNKPTFNDSHSSDKIKSQKEKNL